MAHIGKEMVAKAKKNALIFLGIGIAVAIVGLIIALVAGEVGSVIGVVILTVAAIVIIIGAVKYCQANNLSKQICPECGTKYGYDDIEYHEVSARTETAVTGSSASAKVKIRFKCHCPNCGFVQEYTKEYTEAKVDKNGELHQMNVEDEIRRFYKG